MKRYLLFIIFGATLLWSATSHALGDGTLGYGGGANSNPHNLSAVAGNTNPKKALTQAPPGKEMQICIFCHTPHGATPSSTLWGRPDPTGPGGGFLTLTNPALGISDPTVIGSSLYDSASGNYPNGASKLCLSCHDGVTAMGILADGDEIAMTDTGLATEIVLTTSHPISFVYDANVVSLLVGLGKSLQSPTPAADYLDGSDRVQCTSCHQPHQDTRGTGGTYPFWRVGGGSAADYATVCDACHTAPPSSGGTGHTGYP